MRILLSILMFIAGLAVIAYSWIGALAPIGGELGSAESLGEASSAIEKIFHIMTTGEIPQLTVFFYIGLLIIVISVLYLVGLFGGKSKSDIDND